MRLNGFYHGRKKIASRADFLCDQGFTASPDLARTQPTAAAYLPIRLRDMKGCYLDDAEQIVAPISTTFAGLPQGLSDPLFGSNNTINLNQGSCFDRISRYGAYLSQKEPNTTLYSDDSTGLASTQRVNYSKVKWAEVQTRCGQKNKMGADLRPKIAFVIRTWHDV